MTDVGEIRFRGITKSYRGRRVLDGADIELTRASCTLLCGANGSGKTTLLKIMAGLVHPDRGTIRTGLLELGWRRCRRALLNGVMYLHQQPYMFDTSVRRNIAYGVTGGPDSQVRERIDRALEWAGLEPFAEVAARRLSGGEIQRVALARAWARAPATLLLDEPTASMDAESRLRTRDLLRRLGERGMTIVITSHDEIQFGAAAQRRLRLEDGRLRDVTEEETRGNVSVFPPERTSVHRGT